MFGSVRGVRMRKARRRGTRRVPRRRAWTASQTAHFNQHKEAARALVHERLAYFNRYYTFTYHRVSIRNTRTRWGSCSDKGNLNFSYRILFLSPDLQDYLIVHELCHLKEMNHGPHFWSLVAEQIPDYTQRNAELRAINLAACYDTTI